MAVEPIVRLMPHAATRAGHGPRRLSLAASLAAGATLIACLAAGCASVAPARSARAGTGSADTAAVVHPLVCGPADYFIQCYSPGQYQVAYGVAPLLSSGITGRGETVVMPELANVPGRNFTDIRRDLAAFDRKFRLPAAKLTVTTTLAGAGAPYVAGTEEVEDTEMVHAIAPGATLDVVLVPPTAVADAANFTAAVTGVIHAAIAQHAAVVSISGSKGEHLFTPAEVSSMHAALQQAAGRHLTVVASSGDTGVISDNGPPKQVSLPASDPLVLGAGGTALDASFATGAYHGEMAWNADTSASAGGYSSLFGRPSYQDGLPRIGRMRGVPDVAADADYLHRHDANVQWRRPVPSPGHQRRHPAVGGRDRPRRSGRRAAPRLRQPGHLRHRAQPRLPPGLPRRGHRRQLGVLANPTLHRLPGRTRLGPGLRLRDVPDDVVAALEAHARRLGLSRTEYVRRRLAQDAAVSDSPVSTEDLTRFADTFGDLADPDVMSQAWQ